MVPSVYVVFFNNRPWASAGTVIPAGVLYETDSTTLSLVAVWTPTAVLIISSTEVEGAGVVNEFSVLGSAHTPNALLSPVAYTLPATSNTTV